MNSNGKFLYDGPLGRLMCTFDGFFLTALSIRSHSARDVGVDETVLAGPMKGAISSLVSAVFRELDAYFSGEPLRFSRNLYRMKGTDFEQAVWKALLEVPYGEVRTYKWLAERIGRPGAARAVGQALGRNPLAIIVPCHRIVSSNGTLGGFSCGIEVKKWLLNFEKNDKQSRDRKR